MKDQLNQLRSSVSDPEKFVSALGSFPKEYYSDIYFSTVIEGRDILVSEPTIEGTTLLVTLTGNLPDKDGKIKKETVNPFRAGNLGREVAEEIISNVEAALIRNEEDRRKDEEARRIRHIIDQAESRKENKNEL